MGFYILSVFQRQIRLSEISTDTARQFFFVETEKETEHRATRSREKIYLLIYSLKLSTAQHSPTSVIDNKKLQNEKGSVTVVLP